MCLREENNWLARNINFSISFVGTLFDDIVFTAILIYSMALIIYLFSHIILNLISASVNKNALKSHKFLFKFQTKFLSLINVKQRIKVYKIIEQK
jgi:uncharacterized protein YggT (Ycf19 family)